MTQRSRFNSKLQHSIWETLRGLKDACRADVLYTEYLSASITLNTLTSKLDKSSNDHRMISTKEIIDDNFDISELLCDK